MGRLLGRVGWPERVGIALLIACLAWAAAAAIISGRPPSPASPYVIAPVVLSVGVAAGPVLARFAHAAPRSFADSLAIVAGFLILGVLLTPEPGKEPLGYANANAALAVQVVGMCGLGLLETARGRRMILGASLTLGVVAVALNRSTAGLVVVGPLVAAIALALWSPPARRWWAVMLGATTTLAGAAVIAWLAARSTWSPWAERAFDPVRAQLWRDAMALWRADPLTGGGPGSFREATALSADPDTASAHSSILQIGSETGWVGVALFALVALAGLLWATRGRAPYAVVGAAAWTALLLHSFVDHLLEFPPVVLAAGLVLGWAAGSARSEQLDVAQGESPLLR